MNEPPRRKTFFVVLHMMIKETKGKGNEEGKFSVKKELIVVSSVTYAMKGKELLERNGFHAYITRLPRETENVGCGYCIYVTHDTNRAEQLLQRNGIRVLGRHGTESNDI